MRETPEYAGCIKIENISNKLCKKSKFTGLRETPGGAGTLKLKIYQIIHVKKANSQAGKTFPEDIIT